MHTRIKICGLRDAESIHVAVDNGADAVGFVFDRSSARYIDPESAFELVAMLPPFVLPVGVFTHAKPETILRAMADSCVQAVQIHGPFDSTALSEMSSEAALIRAVEFDPAAIRRASQTVGVDLLLIDGSTGGGGTTFAWNELASIRDEIEMPFVVAGGLTAGNVAEAIRLTRPFAVDVSSGVESLPGVKDAGMIRAFCDAVRAADRALDEALHDEPAS